MDRRHDFYVFSILGDHSWFLDLFNNTQYPAIAHLVWNFDKENNSCVFTSSEKWINKAYILTWEIVVALTLILMVVSHSKVVYTVWFKRNDDHQLLHQQRVRGMLGLEGYGLCWVSGMCHWMESHFHD